MPSAFVYESRYRFGPLSLGCVAVGLIGGLVVLGLDLPDDVRGPVAAGLFAVAGTVLVLFGHAVLTRKVGLRLDETGIHVGGRPPVYGRTQAFVGWRDIEAVYLFRFHVGITTVTNIGLDLRPGADRPRTIMTERLAATIWHVPTDVVMASWPAAGWELDRVGLAAAVGYFAPAVRIIDLTEVAPMQSRLPRQETGEIQ